MRHQLTFLALVGALLLGAPFAEGAQAPPRPIPDLYYVDCREDAGSIRAVDPGKTVLYTPQSGPTWFLAFSPWDPDLLYIVGRNSPQIVEVDLEAGTESVVHTHTTTITGLAFDAAGALHFSSTYVPESDGSRSGAIYRIGATGDVSVVFRPTPQMLDRSTLDFWRGHFRFAPDGTVLLSTGKTVIGDPQGGFLYAADPGSGSLTALYASPEPMPRGFARSAAGQLYITKASSAGTIFKLDPGAGTAVQVYDLGGDAAICDLAFRASSPPQPVATGTWVMPYGLSAFRVDQIKPTGLVDYGGVVDAPFGGKLGFRFDSSNDVPGPATHYYRLSYRRQGSDTWIDFDAPIFVHYVKNRPGKTPVFPLFKLGPEDFDGINLYRFRPREEDLAGLLGLPPGIAEWPKIGFPGDAIRGILDTVALGLAPGNYEILYRVYDENEALSPPGTGFQMIVPVGLDPAGAVQTQAAPVTDDDGLLLTLHVDNRPTEAAIEPPRIDRTVTDDCGFLRYDTLRPGEVHLAWRAWHPAGHATYSLAIVKGAQALSKLPVAKGLVDLPGGDEVTSTEHHGNLGSFWENSPTLKLLEPCDEAAFAARLKVNAKAVNGAGNRLEQYDSSVLRAFAIAPK